MSDDVAMAARAVIASQVADFYEHHPYPPPVDGLEDYRRSWDLRRRKADSYLFWPGDSYRDDRTILVAGCGTSQAARYAVRWPNARVVGIDVSETSLDFERDLKRKHRLDNLEVHRLAIEDADELHERFEHIVCTGVLHHLPDPDAGLAALRDVLMPEGAMHLMVYAPYGRAGIYMLQEYCKRIGVRATEAEICDLVDTLKSLPSGHPIDNLLRSSPDFATEAGVADALLHPNDRAYTVTQFMQWLDHSDMTFGRWIRQAPYLASCGAPAATPHAARLAALPAAQQYAALELLRGSMVRHSAVVYRSDRTSSAIRFDGDGWLQYVPIRQPDTVTVYDRLPPGAAAVLINRNHSYPDSYLPIDAAALRLLEAIDGTRRIAGIGWASIDKPRARDFFQALWNWDQVVFDLSGAH